MRRVALLLGGLLLLPVAGCRHRVVQAVVLPPLPPETRPVMVSVPPPSHPTEPLPTAPETAKVEPPKMEPPKKIRRPKRAMPAPPAVTPPVQVAAATPPPATIELGQLSAGGEAVSGLRSETETLLRAQRQRVDHLSAPLVAAHGTDVDQAKRFVKGAEDAWGAADVEGAHTLALKAKVLLDDLQK